MLRAELAVYGSKAQSFAGDNPRALLLRIVNENLGADPAEILEACLAEIEQHPEYIEPIVEYWFINTYRQIRARSNRPSLPSREMVDGIKQQIGEISLLELMLPHGKRLADSTGSECARAGGWLSRISERIKSNETVASVLSEAQVREIFGACDLL